MIAAEARYAFGDRTEIRIRQHRVVADQPVGSGGTDDGPTPTELFVAALAGCAVFYVERFLRRHASPDGLVVRATAQMSDERPARLASIGIEVDLPAGLSAELSEGALRAADRCLVREALRHPPEITVVAATGERKTAAASSVLTTAPAPKAR